MFKGARKAIVRAPHRMVGNKSIEDKTVIEWTKDFQTAQSALDLLVDEARQSVQCWRAICEHNASFADTLRVLYDPIVEENLYKTVQETSASSQRAVEALDAMAHRTRDRILPVVDHLDQVFVHNCRQCRELCVDYGLQLLKKREHKKLDFDRHSNTVEKMQKKQTLTDKEQQQLEKHQAELDRALQDFEAQDNKCKDTVPRLLTLMSEFLNPMCSTMYLSQLEIFEVLKNEYHEYCVSQGLLVGDNDYEQIVDEWETAFVRLQPACEEGIKTLREGDTVAHPMELPSKRKKRDVAARVLQSSLLPKKKPVQFASSLGMFRTEADIGSSPSSTIASTHPEERRSISSKRSSSSSGVGNGNGNAHVSPFSPSHTPSSHSFRHHHHHHHHHNHPELADPATLTRVRAFSSSSARALSSPPHELDNDNDNDNEKEYATAVYTFLGNVPGDVAFKAGDRIRVLDHGDATDDMWWFGQTRDGRLGLFPCNYVKLLV